MKKRIKNRIDFQERRLDFYAGVISAFILISVLFLTVGYSALSSTGRIESIMASVQPAADVRITNITVDGTTNGGLSNSEGYSAENIYGTLSLPNADSTVTYKVAATVFLGAEMKISDITGLDSHLEYELTDYLMGDVLCNTNGECTYGATDEFYITIRYKTNGYDANNTVYPFDLLFTFEEATYVARIGNTHYGTLQAAINAVATNDTETTVVLLKNTSEVITVAAHKNIVLNLQSKTLSNDGVNPVITNRGTLKIMNGVITSDSTQGVINNETGGFLDVAAGARILATGTKQAIYNDGGSVVISDGSYLSATSNQRAAVQNQANGTMRILGGTIVSTRYYAVQNAGTLDIGDEDGIVHWDAPILQGSTYGVYATANFNFYDGTIKSKNNIFNNTSYISDIESGYEYFYSQERINGTNYNTVCLAVIANVTFNANGGSVDVQSRQVRAGTAVGALPDPTRANHEFIGWYTASSDGRKIDATEIINSDIEFFAQWLHESQIVTAEINGVTYNTLQAALDAVPNNTLTTITLLRDTNGSYIITANKRIAFDFQGHTLSNHGNNPVITNRGNLTILSGTITSNATQGAINNETGGTLTISGGSVIATGIRQALYNNGGTAYITGNAYLSAVTTERAAVQNLANGVLNITGGTIVSTGLNGVENVATLNIGTKDGNIVTSVPIIQGVNYGVNTSGTLNFYDGVIKGKVDSINGTVNDQEQNSTRVNTTETIDGLIYHVTYLQ